MLAQTPDPRDAAEWMQLTDRYGLPLVLLFTLLFLFIVLGLGFLWVLKNFLQTYVGPTIRTVGEKHVELIDTVKEATERQTETSRVQAEATKEISQSTAQVRDCLHDVAHTIAGRGQSDAEITRAIEQIPECEDRRRAVFVHTERAREIIQQTQLDPRRPRGAGY